MRRYCTVGPPLAKVILSAAVLPSQSTRHLAVDGLLLPNPIREGLPTNHTKSSHPGTTFCKSYNCAHGWPLPPAPKIGPYGIQALLVAGGTGKVYRARDACLDRKVRIKSLPESFANDAYGLERFVLCALDNRNLFSFLTLASVVESTTSFRRFTWGVTWRHPLRSGASPWRS
jgi:hypothetical protein